MKTIRRNKYREIMHKLGAEPIEGQAGGLSEAQLDKMEIDLDCSLGDYREFLRCYGGYEIPDTAMFPIKPNADGKHRRLIETFYGWSPELTTAQDDYYGDFLGKNMTWDFLPGTGIELVRSYPSNTQTIRWPKELIVIGEDPGGNYTCLAISGLRPGAVFCWMTSGDVYLAADSFDEFMHSLCLGD